MCRRHMSHKSKSVSHSSTDSDATMADVIRQFGAKYLARFGRSMPFAQRNAMRAIEACRTPALGGHLVRCQSCDVQEFVYHSCRHRACPKCGQLQAHEWLEARRTELLPVPYFHIVFTVPEKLRWLIRKHQKELYPKLITAAAHTLTKVAAKSDHMAGTIGIMAVLHTWTRTLDFHPHVHCLVPAGYVDEHGAWQKASSPWLAPHEVLAKVFRAKFCAMMRAAVPGLQLPGSVHRTQWVVHVDLPKHGSDTVLKYLARYVHRVALSDHRILKVTATHVRFKYRTRDRRDWQFMTLKGHEFLRRFLQHVWPKGFHKVRYFGLWSRSSHAQLMAIRQKLVGETKPASSAPAEPASNSTPDAPRWLKCPHCKTGQRVILAQLKPGEFNPARLHRPQVHSAAPDPTPPP